MTISKQSILDHLSSLEELQGEGEIVFQSEHDLADYILAYCESEGINNKLIVLKERLESKTNGLKINQKENKRLQNDIKAKKGLITSLNIQQRKLRFVLAHAIDLIPEGYYKIEALQALADDCKHL